MKVLLGFIIALALLYIIALVGAYFAQTSLIFYPRKLARAFQFGAGAQEVFLTTRDNETINGLFFTGTKKEVILYFHGNAGDLSTWQYIMADFAQLGYGMLIIDYRGYGKSTGTLSEEGLYADADAAYEFLISKGFAAQQIIIYGRSIGTGVATDLASRKPCKGLVLESPYTNMIALAKEKARWLLPGLILKYRLDNLSKLRHIHVPIVFFHGTKDELIPAAHTDTLYANYTGVKKKILIEGAGHNDTGSFAAYHEALKNLFG
jgi:fermentation-respiration switch protein FrsA (DUF1100 family)